MEKKFIGFKYAYLIVADLEAFYFEIQSKYIDENRSSTITNLNYLLSELGNYYTKNDEVEESTWIIKSNIRLRKLWQITNELFNDNGFIKYLEEKLDEDRACGGWNSYINL